MKLGNLSRLYIYIYTHTHTHNRNDQQSNFNNPVDGKNAKDMASHCELGLGAHIQPMSLQCLLMEL